MNFATLVKSRLTSLGFGQRDLARAAQVTDSYVSQLLTRRKAPPARDRTDIYTKMEGFLGLVPGELGRLAEDERTAEIRRKLDRVPEPLFQEFRNLVLRKCVAARRDEVREIFEGHPFGTLERLVTRALLELVQRIARRELESENWARLAALVGSRSHEEMRVILLDFLDIDVYQVSRESCVVFIDPLVEFWDIDLDGFRLDIRLDSGVVPDPHRTFTFGENPPVADSRDDPGLADFLEDPQLSADVSEEELRSLRRQRPSSMRPNKLYYYRALQNLRDPLHRRS